MKLLMSTDAVGGVWTYSMELCRALAVHEVEITLATMGPRPSDAQRAEAGRLSNVRLECSDYKLEWMQDPWSDVDHAGQWLLDLARRDAVDLVHLNGYAHASLPWQRPVLVVAHSCVRSWWQAVHGSDAPDEWHIYRERVAEGLACADRVVAPTRAFLQTLRDLYGDLPPSQVIHNARSPHPYTFDESLERLPIVLACGRMWDEAKNLRVLDQAAKQLHWRVYAAGRSVAPDGRCVHAQTLWCLGSLSATDLAEWLRRAAIFAHPARYEPFGLSVLEAALAGCVLVLADLPSLRELWEGAAVFVRPDDAAAWHSALNDLIEDPRRRKQLAIAARGRAQMFEPDAMAAAYAGLYRELLSQRRERAVA